MSYSSTNLDNLTVSLSHSCWAVSSWFWNYCRTFVGNVATMLLIGPICLHWVPDTLDTLRQGAFLFTGIEVQAQHDKGRSLDPININKRKLKLFTRLWWSKPGGTRAHPLRFIQTERKRTRKRNSKDIKFLGWRHLQEMTKKSLLTFNVNSPWM